MNILNDVFSLFSGGGSFASAVQRLLKLFVVITYIWGFIAIVRGGIQISHGQVDEGKTSIVGGFLIAGAGALISFFFSMFYAGDVFSKI